IIFLHEHYKDVKETHNMLLALEDPCWGNRPGEGDARHRPCGDKQQQATRIDFSRNENPAY
ncbi:MAG: hypothetical protein ACKPKO_00095, partial [Candidatus Fonsibacter sp.]